MKNLLMLILFFIATGTNAAEVCEGKTEYNYTFRLTLHSRSSVNLTVIDSSGKQVRSDDYEVHNMWDGHSQGLMTAPGLSIRYQDSYGIMRNLVVTALTSEQMGQGWVNTAKIDMCR